ncbi:MAG: hypothetical protein WCR49_13135 [Opitutae bacterium]
MQKTSSCCKKIEIKKVKKVKSNNPKSNKRMNANMMIESEMLTSTLEREMRKLIKRAQKEVLEVCSKEYNIDINAAMLLVNAGMERKKPTASGIAKEKVVKEKKAKEPKEKKPQPPPQPGNQKVGGQQDKKAEEQSQDPELAMPLQKLDQVRNQDSPAKLQQLMQGQQQKPKPTAKDW